MAICNPDFNSSDFYSGDFQTTTIDFVFQTFTQDRLPDYFRRNDTYVDENGDGLLMRYLSIFGDEIDQEIIPTIECYLNIIDAQNCDPQYLTHLSDVLGNPPDIFGDDDKYRNLLSYICSVYKIKGTKKAYELFFSLLGFDIDFYDAFDITSFSKLPSCLFDEAVMFIADWFPDDDTMELSIFVEDEFQRFIYRYVDSIPKESPAYQQMMEDFMYAVCSGAKGPD